MTPENAEVPPLAGGTQPAPGCAPSAGTPVSVPPLGGRTGARKPRLSGAQRRKLARQSAVAAAAVTGVFVPPMPTLGSLDNVVDYRRELNVVYKRMRSGHMHPEDATKAVFILNTGAALARAEQELRELTQLRERVDAIQASHHFGDRPPALTVLETAGDVIEGDPLPILNFEKGSAP